MHPIIEQKHRNKITQGKDGRWRTNVTIDGKRKMIVRVKREDLEQFLLDHYKADKDVTMRELFPDWLEHKKDVAETTIIRIRKAWKTYYENDDMVDRPIRSITKQEMKDWIIRVIKERKLDMKQYCHFIGIINGVMVYAVEQGVIEHNVRKDISIDLDSVLTAKEEKEDRDQVFTEDEVNQINDLAMEDFKNETHPTHKLVPLTVPFMFKTGLRVGEISALKHKDIKGRTMRVRRMYREATDEVVEKTKGKHGPRTVALTDEAQDILVMASAKQEEDNVQTEFVFSMTAGPAPYREIQKAFYHYCDRVGTSPKSSHKARKTYISTLVDSGINISTIAKQAGHVSKSTTIENYTFDRGTSDEIWNKINDALRTRKKDNDAEA